MDFNVIFKLRTKKLWWVDVIFYFAISLLVATLLCYLIFFLKNIVQREDIKKENEALQTVGTEQQKGYEKEVIGYQKKIIDFAGLFENHEFASNAFAFFQTQTLPKVWFEQFSLDKKGGSVQLSGEAENMDILGRQVSNLEKNEYIKNIGDLSSSLGGSARAKFNLNLTLDQSIFSYLSEMASVLNAAANLVEQTAENENPPPTNKKAGQVLRDEKLITAFHILLIPEVVGIIDQTNYKIALDVPFGADVKNLIPSIVMSPEASILPDANIPQDFTSPVVYRVTAQDGSTQDYEVTVNVLPEFVNERGKTGLNIWAVVALVFVAAAAAAIIILFTFRRMKNKRTKSEFTPPSS